MKLRDLVSPATYITVLVTIATITTPLAVIAANVDAIWHHIKALFS